MTTQFKAELRSTVVKWLVKNLIATLIVAVALFLAAGRLVCCLASCEKTPQNVENRPRAVDGFCVKRRYLQLPRWLGTTICPCEMMEAGAEW
ncbi:MAG: hypothetical protein KF893_00815 [Caldilineaceae bacterium]|nr:hypothetical protein [Caldilineaceae bacterium]